MKAALGEGNCWRFDVDTAFAARKMLPCPNGGTTAVCDRGGALRLMSSKLDKQLAMLPAPPVVHTSATAPSFTVPLDQNSPDGGAANNFSLSLAICEATEEPTIWVGWSSGHITIAPLRGDGTGVETTNVLYAHRGAVHCLEGQGTLMLSTSSDRTTLLWDTMNQSVLRSVSNALQQSVLIRAVAWTPPHLGINRRQCLVGDDAGMVKLLDMDAICREVGDGGSSKATKEVGRVVMSLAPSSVRCLAVDHQSGALWGGAENGVLAFHSSAKPSTGLDPSASVTAGLNGSSMVNDSTLSSSNATRSRSNGVAKVSFKLKYGAILAIQPLFTATTPATDASIASNAAVAVVGCADNRLVAVQVLFPAHDHTARMTPLFSIPLQSPCMQLTPPPTPFGPMYAICNDGSVSVLFFPQSSTQQSSAQPHIVASSRSETSIVGGSTTSRGPVAMTAADRENSVKAVEKRYEQRLKEMIEVVREARESTIGCEDSLTHANNTRNRLMEENESLRVECDRLAAALERTSEQVMLTQGDLRQAGDQAADTLAETIKLNAECSAQARVIETMKADEARHISQINSLRDQIRATDDVIAAKEHEVSDLQRQLSESRISFEEQLQNWQVEKEHADKSVRTASTLAEKAAAAEKEAQELRIQLRAEVQAHAKTQSLLEEQTDVVRDLGDVNRALRGDLDVAEREISAAEAAAAIREQHHAINNRANQRGSGESTVANGLHPPPHASSHRGGGFSSPAVSVIRRGSSPEEEHHQASRNSKMISPPRRHEPTVHQPLQQQPPPASHNGVVHRSSSAIGSGIRPARGVQLDL